MRKQRESKGNLRMLEKWINCTVFPGQFTGEYAIKSTMFDGTEFSLFAPKEALDIKQEPTLDHPVKGKIKVQIEQQEDDLLMVRLPRPTFENGQCVTVKTEQVSS